MFAPRSGILANPILVSAVILTLAAISLSAVTAHGFDLKPTWQDGMKAAIDVASAGAGRQCSRRISRRASRSRRARRIVTFSAQ